MSNLTTEKEIDNHIILIALQTLYEIVNERRQVVLNGQLLTVKQTALFRDKVQNLMNKQYALMVVDSFE